MIAILIAILVTVSTGGDLCALGSPVTDWTAWATTHTHALRVMDYEASEPNFWVYADGDEVVLFVFQRPIADVISEGGGADHGQCARVWDVNSG